MPTPNVYFKILIGFVLLLISFCSGFYVEHLRFVDYKEGVIAQAQVQEKHNQDVLKEREIENAKIKNDYENQLARIKSYYSSVGLHDSSISSMSKPSATLVTVNGYTTDPVFAEQCANTTAQLVSLQNWVREQIGIK